MPIVDLGSASEEGNEAIEVGSHGLRRASTRPPDPRPITPPMASRPPVAEAPAQAPPPPSAAAPAPGLQPAAPAPPNDVDDAVAEPPAVTPEFDAIELALDDATLSEPSPISADEDKAADLPASVDVRLPGASELEPETRVEAALAEEAASVEAPPSRISEIPPEVDPEDLEITEVPVSSFGTRSPPAPPLPLVPLPSYAQPDLAAAVEAERATEDPSVRRARYWWDEMFGDDFLRTMDRMTDPQIQKEVNFIEESLGVQEGAIILDLACGTGRHAVELGARGYNVVGYDLSVAMLARAADEAHDRNQKLNFLQGDMRDMGFEEMFDAVYCWSTSFGYFDDEKNQLVAQRIHRALRKGGMLLLDVANRDFVAKVQPSLVWFEGDGCVCMDDMRVDFITSRLKVKRMIMMDNGRTRELDYSIRLYTLHELGNMLHDVGFKIAEVSGHLATPRVFMGADSPRLLVLAEKA
jgi:SAM-dependent methyltransferase